MNNSELYELEQLAISEVISILYTDDSKEISLTNSSDLEIFMPEEKK